MYSLEDKMYILNIFITRCCNLERLYPLSVFKTSKRQISECIFDVAKCLNISINSLSNWFKFKDVISLEWWAEQQCKRFKYPSNSNLTCDEIWTLFRQLQDSILSVKQDQEEEELIILSPLVSIKVVDLSDVRPERIDEITFGDITDCKSCLNISTKASLKKCTLCLYLIHPTLGCGRYILDKNNLYLYCIQCLGYKRCERCGLFVLEPWRRSKVAV
jgi:hypothetical protein